MPNIPTTTGKVQILLGKNIASTSNYGVLAYTHAGGDASASNYIGLGKSTGDGLVVNQSGNVGIGTTTPSNFIHVQKGGYSTPANNRDGTTFGINFGSTNYLDQVKILAVDRTSTGDIWGGELALYTSTNGLSSTEKVRINAIGNVGIRTIAPAYALDVSAGTTAASVNMSTWPRTTASISYYGVSSATVAGAVVSWTTCNAISTQLMTVANNNGTYFVVNRSGIYSIHAYITGTTAGQPQLYIDVSTNIAHSAINPSTTPQLASSAGVAAVSPTPSGSNLSVSYTGFLPSNSGNYYKIKGSAVTLGSGYNGGRIYITFLGESPNVTGVPY
jgi:hypothetical protein